MHHCLEIQELLENIVAFVDSASALWALATTSRSFSESALDMLWGKHGTLVDLFLLIKYPEDSESSQLLLARKVRSV